MLLDLRYALRKLRESPGFAATAILTLALGIGASTAIFAVLDAVLLEPLPFAQPDRLVAVVSQPDRVVAIATMQDYQSRSTTFSSLAAYREWSPAQNPTGGPPASLILAVTQGFFSTLGTRFALGTPWPITGNEQDCASQVIVSSAYWKRLGASPTLGRRMLNLDGRDYEISGVLAADQTIEGSYSLNRPEVFVQVGCDTQERPNSRGDMSFEVIGRLRPGATVAQANADLARVDRTLRKDYPNYYSDYRSAFSKPPLVFTYIELLVGAETRPALLMTFGACGLLLMIACSNLASLLLARNTRRRSEFATRATLGASFSQLLRQLTVESALLVGVGAAGGIGVTLIVLHVLKNSDVLQLPRLAHASLRPMVVVFVIAVCGSITFFLTLLPAWRTLRPGLVYDLQGVGRSSAGHNLRVVRRSLVVAQLTLTVVLVACAGWLIGGVYLLLHQPLGFAPDHLLMLRAEVGSNHLTKAEAPGAEEKLSEVAASLRHLPGVVSVARTDHAPLGHSVNRYDFCSDLHPEQCKQQVNINPNSYAISPGYFSTIGQTLLEGRDFNDADDGRSHVAIVNEALAEREWPGQTALGHRVHSGEIRTPGGQSWARIVGVVGNVRNYDLVSTPGPDLYIPRAENPSGLARFVIKVSGDPALLKNSARKKLKVQFPEADISDFETMSEEMSNEVSERVFLMQVLISFGALALFLSILGTYGLLAYEVSLRVKEIGIRLALGSSREKIVKLFVYEHGRWLLAGTLLGLACAIATGYAFRSRFYGVHSTSTSVLVGSALLLLLPALLAIAIPARLASLLDPADTLRRE
ncbi:MAG TPA: ADOP family duplicated permease [Candidatus Sulfotelmatobacter sp.]|jgi:predicted permease|nr:ADOP family duplicated permease [Candidatus Sulfotelmatobacter sp.]